MSARAGASRREQARDTPVVRPRSPEEMKLGQASPREMRCQHGAAPRLTLHIMLPSQVTGDRHRHSADSSATCRPRDMASPSLPKGSLVILFCQQSKYQAPPRPQRQYEYREGEGGGRSHSTQVELCCSPRPAINPGGCEIMRVGRPTLMAK